MTKKTSHRSKSRYERQQYQSSINRTSSESTSDYGQFTEFKDDEEALNSPKTVKKRGTGFWEDIGDHLKKHWVKWLFTLILGLCLYLARDAWRDIAVINVKIENQQNKIESIKDDFNLKMDDNQTKLEKIDSNINEIEKENFLQNLDLHELKLKLEFLAEQINKKND
jgi:hypothetical protein